MRETVTIVIAADPMTEDWELHGVYASKEDAERAIAYAERQGMEHEFGTVEVPVLTFPEWVR